MRLPVLSATGRTAFDVDPIELWDAWQFAANEATLRLRIWSTAPNDNKAHAHATYLAALDREEQAALVLEQRLCLTRLKEV
jgi:hypothetical protein